MASWSLPDALQILHQQYPGAFVTSGKRDQNSALGRANPHSYHNVGEAFDIRPMQGVGFNDYVSSLKAAGLPVVEALDEQKNPKPWTTGPNWHIAFSGDRKVATSPIDIIRRAQGFNVDIPQQQPQFNVQQALQGISLPDSSAGIEQSLAANKIKGDERAAKGSKWATILGALSDGLLTLGGQQPMYAPLALRQREADADNSLARDRLNAEIQQRQDALAAKLQEQPQFIQNLQAYQKLPEDQQRAYLSYLDATQPIAVSGPQGTQRVPRQLPPHPGAVEDGFVFLGGDPADKNSWRPQ